MNQIPIEPVKIFDFPPIVEQIVAVIPKDTRIYLVGGAVRDAFLSRTSHDLDFILPENALEFARKVADQLGAAFYPLDPVRNYGRVILPSTEGIGLWSTLPPSRECHLQKIYLGAILL